MDDVDFVLGEYDKGTCFCIQAIIDQTLYGHWHHFFLTHSHSLHVFSDPYYSSTTLNVFDRATPPVKISFDFVYSSRWNWN